MLVFVSHFQGGDKKLEDKKEFLEPYNSPIDINRYSFHLDEDIAAPRYYRSMVEIMVNCSPNDEISIYFNTDGGYFSGMAAIIHAIRLCPCPVAGILYGRAYSAGSAILMECDNVIVGDDASIMVHGMGYGYEGKAPDVESYVVYTTKENKRFLEKSYKDFLTEDELEKVKNGADLYFNSEESKKKLELMYEKKLLNEG